MFHYKSLGELQQEAQDLKVNLPFSDKTSLLAQPLTISGKTIPNRIVIQPMEGCDGTADGRPDELTIRRYDKFAQSGAGLIWFEATAVWEEGRANPRQVWINDQTLDSFKALTDRIRETAVKAGQPVPVIIMQATHSGRYSKPHGTPEPLIAYHNPIFE